MRELSSEEITQVSGGYTSSVIPAPSDGLVPVPNGSPFPTWRKIIFATNGNPSTSTGSTDTSRLSASTALY